MKAYPLPVRQALLAAIDGGMSTCEAARVFGVGRSTVKRYVVQRRTTGSFAPRPHPGRRPLISPEEHPALLTLVRAHPTASQETYCQQWHEVGGTAVSVSTMSRTLHRLGLQRHRPAPGRQP